VIIKPSVGRIVLYYPAGNKPETDQPHAAQIAYVWSDTCINIGYLDQNGVAKNATSVLLHNEEMPLPTTNYCCWMPYQNAVAQGQIPPTLHAS
jgi:hypothetical protein